MPETSVIICTLNGADTITGALDSLVRQQTCVDWELIVSDNGSTDATLAVVRAHELGARAQIVDSSAHPGLAGARNVGVAATSGRFVAFLDDDDEVDPRWIEELTVALRTHRFVGSAMEYLHLNEPATMAGREPFQSSVLGEFASYLVVNGACGVERALWDAVGGNDESWTHAGEDFDFAIRVQLETGVVPVLAEHAIYHYRQRSGLRQSLRQGRRYGRGQVRLMARYADVIPVSDRRRALHMWWWVLSRAPFRIFSAHRAVWARQLGLRLGRLQGSIADRIWCP